MNRQIFFQSPFPQTYLTVQSCIQSFSVHICSVKSCQQVSIFIEPYKLTTFSKFQICEWFGLCCHRLSKRTLFMSERCCGVDGEELLYQSTSYSVSEASLSKFMSNTTAVLIEGVILFATDGCSICK